MSRVLSIEGLTKSFRKVPALDGLNLDVPEGSVFGLIGPNGAGKTTTIKILMNILRPDAGRVEVLGVESRDLGWRQFEKIGYVSENQQMPGWMTIRYLMSYLKPFYPTWDSELADRLIAEFKLPPDRKLRHLSRGMWMKTALVSSLACRPRLLVLDEPFSGLDPLIREDLIEMLVDSANDTTLFISSHDLADIESFTSHIGYLSEGKLEFAEDMASLSGRFRVVEVVVDCPVMLSDCPEWPAHWLRPEATPAVVRFVESRFEEERTANDIRRLFGKVLRISVNPMPLRDIFVTLARSAAIDTAGAAVGRRL